MEEVEEVEEVEEAFGNRCEERLFLHKKGHTSKLSDVVT